MIHWKRIQIVLCASFKFISHITGIPIENNSRKRIYYNIEFIEVKHIIISYLIINFKFNIPLYDILKSYYDEDNANIKPSYPNNFIKIWPFHLSSIIYFLNIYYNLRCWRKDDIIRQFHFLNVIIKCHTSYRFTKSF